MKRKTTLLAVILLACLVLGILYFTELSPGSEVSRMLEGECPRSFVPVMSAEPYYEGELLDAHLHLPTPLRAVSAVSIELGLPTPAWDNTLNLGYLKCLFTSEGYSSAFGFHLFTKYSVTAEVNKAKEMEKDYPGMITHFIMPAMVGQEASPSLSAVEKVLQDNPRLFRGMGELKMFDGKSPDDPYVIGLLDLAREYKLIVMMHPFNRHKVAVEKVVKQYSDVKFLFHGIDYLVERGDGGTIDNRDWLAGLIANNDNVYYSIDEGLPVYGWLARHQGKVVPKEELLPYMKSQFNLSLEQDVALYKNLIERYPDRFLRGTDRWYSSHYDKEVSALMAEYSRAFIARLAPSVQEKFAHKNAEKLLKK